MALLALCYLVSLTFVGYLLFSKRRFDVARDSIEYRIHVNGIRGKSSVTRYVSAVLRSAGLRTYGKTTGTAARIILSDGQDAAVPRRGYANVNEQVGIINSFAARRAQAIVMECMAINPDYQDWLESKVMHSHITIITNVRIDHQEEMGESLLDIAHSLARSVPENAIVIIAERNTAVLEIIYRECIRKRSRLIVASGQSVSAHDLVIFGHMAHPDNVAIGLEVAKLFHIPPRQALQAMAGATPDPGAFHFEYFTLLGREVVWANLFAVNDKESFAQFATMLAHRFPDYYRIAMLNNRQDRPSRVEMFSKLSQHEYRAHAIVALGDYEERLHKSVRRKDIRVALLGNSSKYADSDGDELLKRIVSMSNQPKVLLVGTVNIHTSQSERILSYISSRTGIDSFAPVPLYQLNPKRQEAMHVD